MKKIFAGFYLFLLIPLFSKGYEFTVGGSFRAGMAFEGNTYITGYYQNISIPFTFAYYPTGQNDFAVGFRNRFGYGLMATENRKLYQYNLKLFSVVIYSDALAEHEIYENISFVYKIGRQIRFVHGTGISLKYSFFNIPSSSVTIYSEIKKPDMWLTFLDSGLYHYLSLGPTMDINLEILNLDKTFSFMLGVPVEFLFPTKFLPLLYANTETRSDGKVYIKTYDIDNFYFNFTWGIEFTFSFNYFKGIKEEN